MYVDNVKEQLRVAIMVACHNRKEITKRCLMTLQGSLKNESDKQFDLYVYDDGSTDGTYEMLREEFPAIIVIRGNGNAFWCKSMYRLMKQAADLKYDYYMMINDDVAFYPDAVSTMFESYHQANRSCGIVGATRSSVTGQMTYGGRIGNNGPLLVPNGKIEKCVWADWNCFLIGREVVESIGIIDGKYQHAWGDYDYDFRMNKNKIPIYVAIKVVGECEMNSDAGTYMDHTLGRKERLKKLLSPKGMPFYSYLRYNVKINGILGALKSVYGYCSLIVYILLKKKIG